jgi:hypothetical protein
MFPQENKVGCTLLMILNEELHEVVKANIIQPLERNFHSQPMPTGFPLFGCCRTTGRIGAKQLYHSQHHHLTEVVKAGRSAPSQGKATMLPVVPSPIADDPTADVL